MSPSISANKKAFKHKKEKSTPSNTRMTSQNKKQGMKEQRQDMKEKEHMVHDIIGGAAETDSCCGSQSGDTTPIQEIDDMINDPITSSPAGRIAEARTVHTAHTSPANTSPAMDKQAAAKGWKIAAFLLAILVIGSFWYTPFATPAALGDSAGIATNDPVVQLIVLTDKSCEQCDPSPVLAAIQTQVFPSVEVEEIGYSTSKGKKLAEKYGIQVLPAFLFDEKVAETENYEKVQQGLIQREDKYLLHPASIGGGKHLNPLKGTNPFFGKKEAPVTIIEFSDFQCPFCRRFFEETYPKLKEEYIKTGKVKFYFRDFPLPIHPDAQKAAEAARCAGDQKKFWSMHDEIFKNQDAISVDYLQQYAEGIGLDMAAFSACLNSGAYEKEVQQDVDEGNDMGVAGTPAFFVNGIIIPGALPFEEFKKIIDGELAKQGE
ncbi:DsbA family protein [Candidatus Woesearchaeota archaeon]|nr:DsbA family protein [Candidatus Woesearchaeota archaeon]